MFTTTIEPLQNVVDAINKDLDKYTEHLRNNAMRAGVTAAGVPLKAAFANFASRYRGKGPATRRLRGTNIVVARPHLADSIQNKVWRSQSGNALINFIGPVALEVPHAHWFGKKAPTNRRTRDGQNRGTHLSKKGGPADLIGKTQSAAMQAAVSEFERVVKERLESFSP